MCGAGTGAQATTAPEDSTEALTEPAPDALAHGAS